MLIFRSVLADERLVLKIIKEELTEVKNKFSDERRTQITLDEEDLEIEDLIADEDVVITITHGGYIKRQMVSAYHNQKRGGKGVTALTTKEEDFVEHLLLLLRIRICFSLLIKVKFIVKRFMRFPEAGRQAKGTAIINLLAISGEEKITAVIPIREFVEGQYLVTMTQKGIIKKTSLLEYDTKRKDGIIALTLDDDDELIGVKLTSGDDDIILATKKVW